MTEAMHPCAELMRQYEKNPIYQAFLRDKRIGAPAVQDFPTWKMYAQWQIELHNQISALRYSPCNTNSN